MKNTKNFLSSIKTFLEFDYTGLSNYLNVLVTLNSINLSSDDDFDFTEIYCKTSEDDEKFNNYMEFSGWTMIKKVELNQLIEYNIWENPTEYDKYIVQYVRNHPIDMKEIFNQLGIVSTSFVDVKNIKIADCSIHSLGQLENLIQKSDIILMDINLSEYIREIISIYTDPKTPDDSENVVTKKDFPMNHKNFFNSIQDIELTSLETHNHAEYARIMWFFVILSMIQKFKITKNKITEYNYLTLITSN